MRISISPISFQGRKPEIKKADYISRKTNQIFPVVSASRYKTFGDNYIKSNYRKGNIALLSLMNDIQIQREEIENSQMTMFILGDCLAVSDIIPVLKSVRNSKVGNCGEISHAALGILCAKGYMNSRRASLFAEVTCTDKRTGEVVSKENEAIDHCLVVTSMEQEDKFDESKLNIIIDPWANFADTKENAMLRYKTIFKDKIKEVETYTLKRYERLNYPEGEEINPDDYEIKTRLYTKLKENYPDSEIKRLSENVAFNFKHSLDF